MRLLALFLASALVATPVTPTSTGFPAELSVELQGVLGRYLEAAQTQRDSMRGTKMDLEIDGRLPKLKEQGRMHLVRLIDQAAEATFESTEFTGDDRIKKELIARYLTEEQKSKNFGAMSISPQDYDYKIRAIVKHNGETTYVFDVDPKKRVAGRFRGELWLDGRTGMPLLEKGQLVKSPNVFLTNLRFTREYELKDGISVMKHFSSSADVRLGFGSAELDISFSNFTRLAARQNGDRLALGNRPNFWHLNFQNN
ncbi:MAG: hypothetical protein ABI995_06250 [Acidobacteriota bacterium]